MSRGSLRGLQILLYFISASHLFIGIGINLFPGALPFFASLYGAQVEWTPEFSYIIKPLGAFMVAVGLLAAAAARNPLQLRPVIYAIVILFVIRSAQRLAFGSEISEVFSIDATRNLVNCGFFLILAAALVVLDGKASKAAAAPV